MTKIRYVELNPNNIFNWLSPSNITCWLACKELHPTWWEPETVELREQFGKIWSEEFDKITGHFSKLEESILKEGIKHPISTVSGGLLDIFLNDRVDSNIVFPRQYHSKIEKSLHTHTFGGSRLSIAQKHNILIPCVVHDVTNMFPNAPEITQENFKDRFGDNYIFVSQRPHIRILRHSHIIDGSFNAMNDKTRQAQKMAVVMAKNILHV